jgi:hypothetical protein
MPSGGGSDGSTPSGNSGSESGSSGEVGSFPGGETSGPPPMPSEEGGGGGTHDPNLEGTDSDAGASGDGSESDSDWDDASESDSECGDTGGLPGGVGGMGTDGECIGGGSSSSAADASSDSAATDGAVQGTGGAGEVGEFPPESSEERAERLGKELDRSIDGFDEVLADEQREISSVGRNTEGFGGRDQGDGGISLGQQGESSGTIQVANNAVGAAGSPIDDMSTEEIAARTPDDIPNMVDDDIIARQLREAALAEDDPVLRERLWEEYRKYKGL